MKFLHAADLHLDTPFQGLSGLTPALQERLITAPLMALTRLVKLAIAEHVDFVLLVGDLFDQQSQSVQAQAALMSALEQLNEAQIPVILSFGNHDFQPDLTNWHLPANVHAFGPQVTTVTVTTADQTRVAISGFSYAKRWVTDDLVATYPAKAQADYHIGTLHGQTGVAGDHYAPFSLSELLAKHYDYWALGHIHQRQVLNEQPPVIYSGNIQGRHRGETGPKGCLIVTSQADHTLQPVFHDLTSITWTDWTADLTGHWERQSLVQQLADQLTASMTTGYQLVTVSLPATVELGTSTELALTQGALLTQLQELAGEHWWPVAIEQVVTTDSVPLFGLNATTWQHAGQTVVTDAAVAELAGHLLDEDFLNTALLDDVSTTVWQQQVMQLLTDQYHLTTGVDDDVD
ncbi:metallophosphoesterase family protein [Lactiplantibacillus herbarum]|uniref:metallophosphoesterase family protein n=1 Tax=Lactiplantibacillus herbarum TaxID=1670446 RepID=UPI00064E768A|nr:DNA repair exonuclease [Lactiplantibacillus herbarum]